ncbi:MAG: copper homeostasis protein CutC [Bacteroidales bacterium]|nr:copper homeostasis protein CutC [Bacteroidales bacterium]
MKKRADLEICCSNWESAKIADAAGADRIEICSGLDEGGLTPSLGLIIQCTQLSLKTHVLIRVRSGDFLYAKDEIEIMKKDVVFCRENGVDGVVFGFLKSNGHIDEKLTKEFVELAHPMKTTFHRAFDMCKDPFQALDQLISLNLDYLLTSGQQSTALEGASLIQQLVKKANNKISIMAGSGVRVKLLTELIQKSDADAYHLSARIKNHSKMKFKNNRLNMGSNSVDSEYIIHTQDIDELKKALEILKK